MFPYKERKWIWRGHRINYAVAGPGYGTPVVLIHGFGGNVGHYRKLIARLADEGHYRVYAIDLLGFGASDKPRKLKYTPSVWKDQVLDFIETFCAEPCVLVGNSIGSQVRSPRS